jgi:putative GTP pyrophosphokinase
MNTILEKFGSSQSTYVLDGIREGFFSEDIGTEISSFLASEHLYVSAVREIETKLENLNNEFKYTKNRNPIHIIKTRIKTPSSIMTKLRRRGLDLTVESARQNLTDIAGIRVICPYIDDIYLISNMLTIQDDIELIRTNDYIKNPKPNGYRSLHLIVSVPVFLSNRKELVKAEVQIRTIAMDFWASLEHEIAYKIPDAESATMKMELKECADVINNTDLRMQNLYNILTNFKTSA